MKLFNQNNRQCFLIRPAKTIAQQFMDSKEKKLPEEYFFPESEGSSFRNASNDRNMFYQPIAGLCIDDMGSENIKNNYGNVSNVIGDLIEGRYDSKLTGDLLHGTTNLSVEDLSSYYGGRVISRFREIFNWIIVPGEDRRK